MNTKKNRAVLRPLFSQTKLIEQRTYVVNQRIVYKSMHKAVIHLSKPNKKCRSLHATNIICFVLIENVFSRRDRRLENDEEKEEKLDMRKVYVLLHTHRDLPLKMIKQKNVITYR